MALLLCERRDLNAAGNVTAPAHIHLTELLPERVLPELCHLQAELSAELPYSWAAAILQKFLPATGGLWAMTTRNRTLVVGKRIEAELVAEVDCPMPVAEPAKHRRDPISRPLG